MLILKICTFQSSSVPIFAGKDDCSRNMSFCTCTYKKTIDFYGLQPNKFWNGRLKGRMKKQNKHPSSLHDTGGPAASICMVSVMGISEEDGRCLHWHLPSFCIFLASCCSFQHCWTSFRILAFHLDLTHCLALKCILMFVMVQIYCFYDKNVGVSLGTRLRLENVQFRKTLTRKTR